MDANSSALVERELRQRLSEAERLLSRAEERIRSQSVKFRQLLSEAEAKNLEEKLAYLDLENKYERERMMRINLEKPAVGHIQSRVSGPSISLKRKATTDIIVIEDDPVVVESDSTNGKAAEVCLEAPKRRKLERHEGITLDSNENSEINIASTVSQVLLNERMPTSSRMALQEPIRTVTPQPTSRNSSTSVTPPDTASVSEGSSTPSPEPVNTLMSNSPMKSKLKLKSSPRSPKIASSSTLSLPDMPIKTTKKAEGGLSLIPSQVAKYLGSTKMFPIFPPPVMVRVSRSALSEAYGLPGMGFLWVSKSKRNPLRIMIPTYEVNPEMPRAPGEPGILLSCREEMCKGGPWTLFVKVEGLKKARWDYAGEYTCQTVGKMSKEEFQAQDAAVKETWGEKIETHKKFPAYRNLRARITVRKAVGREPTDDEVADEAARIKSKDYTSSLTCKDVIRAFERGEEFINVVKTECVAYHHSRAEEYARAQETYEAITKAEARLSKPECKRRREARKKRRTPATAPATYDTSTTPQNVASTSGTRQETPASSPASTQERVVRQRKKSSKVIDQ